MPRMRTGATDAIADALDTDYSGISVCVETVLANVRGTPSAELLSDEDLRELIALQALARGQAVAFGDELQD
jgi:hypothetical protein